MPLIEKHFGPRVRIEYRDIGEGDNYRMLFTLKQKLGADEKSVFPVLYISGKFLDGREDANLTYESIASFIASGIGRSEKAPIVAASNEDVVKYFKNLGPFAIMAAGFIDGINPCAFTVIVFFMSFLFFQGYKKGSIAAVGMSFIIAVFVTYLLLGIGLFSWLHVMKGYQLLTRIISISIGTLSIIFGVLSIYDAVVFLKKGESEDMVLHLPKSLKNKVQYIIGEQYRIKKDKQANTSVFALIASALAVGFIISLFESVCTGQMYLPTIVFVLKTTPHKIHALGYLILYNFMFTVPLIAIYCLALAGVSSQSFTAIMKKNMFLIKIFLAAMFLFLGVSLVHADNSIAPAHKAKAEVMKDPNFYDFGKVKEGDILKHSFTLKNTEDNPVHIKEVNTSCACTTPKVGSKTIMPGQETLVEISFDTKGYPGVRKRQLFVHTDSKKNALVIFEIQADVQ